MRKTFVLLVCIRMLVVCIRMYPYVPYVTRMYSCGVLVMNMLRCGQSRNSSQNISSRVDFIAFRVVFFLSDGRYGFRRFSRVERW